MKDATGQTIASNFGATLVVVLLIFAVAIFLGFRSKQKQASTRFVWWPTLVAIPAVFIVLVFGISSIGNQVKDEKSGNDATEREVFVFETPYPGDRFADLTSSQLSAIERSADARAKLFLEGLGQPASPLSSKATPTIINGTYALQVETLRGSELISFAVLGLVGKTLLDVHCVPTEEHRATFRYEGSECQKMANERIVRSSAN